MQLRPIAIVLMLLTVVVAEADAQKWELTAFGGYRWGGELSDGSANDDLVNVSDLQFEDGPCWGFSAGYKITTRFELELLFDRQHTSLTFVNQRLGADSTLGDAKVDYLMAGLSVDLLSPDYKLMPYFTFYLGTMHLAPDDADSNWFSSVGYALGATYFFNEHFGAMVENRGMSTIVTSSSSLVCSQDNPDNCIVLPADTWMWQIGLSLGVVVVF